VAVEPELRIQELMSDGASTVLALTGLVRRSTVSSLAVAVSGTTGAGPVVIDLSGIGVANTWLLSCLAKAHAVLRARRATMHLIVDDDGVFELLHISSFDRVAPVFLTRRFDSELAARLKRRRGGSQERQRVIDLTTRVQSGPVAGSTSHPGYRTLPWRAPVY
jgi:hypothetical protein